MSHFWDIETLRISPEDVEQTCAVDHLKSYQDKCILFEDSKYKARLPWKEDHPNLPTNYEIVKKRTESTVRRLSKDPEMLAQYNKIIQDQERRGFIERVEHEETTTRLHFIPHHGVKKDCYNASENCLRLQLQTGNRKCKSK